MTLEDELLPIERGFWYGDADYYRRNLDELCVIAFSELAGAFKKEELAGMIAGAGRWRDLDVDVKACLAPVPDFAILAYAVKVRRKSNDLYAAMVMSGYVKRNGTWRMVLHQQTPLSAGT